LLGPRRHDPEQHHRSDGYEDLRHGRPLSAQPPPCPRSDQPRAQLSVRAR
jgi:hypothetical protein